VDSLAEESGEFISDDKNVGATANVVSATSNQKWGEMIFLFDIATLPYRTGVPNVVVGKARFN
jgi:hypothetical protein